MDLRAAVPAPPPPGLVAQLRRQGERAAAAGIGMGAAIGACLGGPLAISALHEVGPEDGAEVQHGAVVAAFAALLLGRLPRGATGGLPWLWVAGREDLHAPGLLALGLDPGRLVLACARDDAGVLAAMEAGLRGGGFAAVVGEAGHLSRVAGRRLQLACLRHGRMGLLLHRWPYGRAGPQREEQTAAVTRWRIGAVPSAGPFAPPRWRLALLHARGGVPGEWIVEAGERDAADPVRVVAELADPAAAAQRRGVG
jgi:protein ImuA